MTSDDVSRRYHFDPRTGDCSDKNFRGFGWENLPHSKLGNPYGSDFAQEILSLDHAALHGTIHGDLMPSGVEGWKPIIDPKVRRYYWTTPWSNIVLSLLWFVGFLAQDFASTKSSRPSRQLLSLVSFNLVVASRVLTLETRDRMWGGRCWSHTPG